MITRRRIAGTVSLIVLALAGCGSATTPPHPATSTLPKASAGKIIVSYAQPQDDTEALWAEVLKVGGLDGIADALSTQLKLPRDIHIQAVNGTVGPHYDPSTHTITLSYGFVDYEATVYKSANPNMSDEELGRRVAQLNAFIVMHELGHALVDQLELPITGKEEDAVDGLATAFLTEFVEGGEQMAFESAEFFGVMAKSPELLNESDFWNEHSLDAVRAYQIVCWVAGSSDEAYQAVAAMAVLGADRLQRCPAEHEQNVKSWFQLLKPHVRTSS